MTSPVSYAVWFERWLGDDDFNCYILCSPETLESTKKHVRSRAAAAKRQAPGYKTRVRVEPIYAE